MVVGEPGDSSVHINVRLGEQRRLLGAAWRSARDDQDPLR